MRLNKQSLQSVYFKSKLFINGILELPAQTGYEIRVFKNILDHFNSGNKINIFEWGSGFSTIFYARYLIKKNVDFEWHSIDNSRLWHESIRAKVDKRGLSGHIKMYLKEFLPFWEKPGWGSVPPACGVFTPKLENEKDYINFPKSLKMAFDVIIIDARFRRHCLRVSKEVISADGVVILHDAQKRHYHDCLADFKYSRFITTGSWYPFQKIPNKIWVASMGNSRIFNSLT